MVACTVPGCCPWLGAAAGCSYMSQHPKQALLQYLLCLQVDSQHVIVDPRTRSVQCSNEPLSLRVDRALQRLQDAMRPIPISTET